MRRWMAWSVAAVILLVVVVAGGTAIHRRVTYGHFHDEADRSITTSVNAVFTVVVPDRGASVGDHWTVAVGDSAIARQVRSTLVSDGIVDRLFGPEPGGGGGKRFVTFRAKAAGVTTIDLTNCFQGCDNDRTRAESRTVSWTVTVER